MSVAWSRDVDDILGTDTITTPRYTSARFIPYFSDLWVPRISSGESGG